MKRRVVSKIFLQLDRDTFVFTSKMRRSVRHLVRRDVYRALKGLVSSRVSLCEESAAKGNANEIAVSTTAASLVIILQLEINRNCLACTWKFHAPGPTFFNF